MTTLYCIDDYIILQEIKSREANHEDKKMPSKKGLEVLKKTHIVTKCNTLNQVYASNMTLQQCRFLSIYLSKIDNTKPETRIVRFPLEDFQKIMEQPSRLNMKQIKETTDSLLRQIMTVPNIHGGYDSFQFFKRCRVAYDEKHKPYVEIDAHDEALPLFFGFRDKYFKYRLWNTLSLKSVNQVRMYELLKEYQGLKYREFTLEDLRKKLGIKKDEYPRFTNFKTRVLDSCKKALERYTDICFDYKIIERGQSGKVIKLGFSITENTNCNVNLSPEEFICNLRALYIDYEEPK